MNERLTGTIITCGYGILGGVGSLVDGLPSGLVTFVFTDIEGSTRLFRRIGDRYPALLARHEEILRSAWLASGGVEIKTDGDAFFVAFAEAGAAIQGCAQAQRVLSAEPWSSDAEIRVRMGVHTGLASPRGRDYIAFPVHQAARVVDTGHGGQVVVSADAAERVTDLGGLELTSLGRYRVRDFDEPVELFEVRGPGLPGGFPPLRVLPADRHNLAAPLTKMVGRSSDLVVLADLVTSSRLVSVVGPGGLGKTRLVMEFGLQRAQEWEHGVWFVDLAPVSDPALVPQAVADAIGAASGEGIGVWASVLDYLKQRRALLIFDNCEHLTTSVAHRVDELLRACPAVVALTTSRQPLGLVGERSWRLPALASDGAAVELFLDRAGITGDRSPDLEPAVAELCRLLDGLPLAIELAAARCDVLTPVEILARIGRQGGLLRSDDPTQAARHHSLEETIDWSYQLLTPDEQLTFRRLGVFAAGFGLESACAAVADDAVDPYDVPERVWSLVSKSLVMSEPAAGSTRYRMLDTVRAHSQRLLERTKEMAGAAARLGRYYLDALGPQLDKLDADLVAERNREIDNLRGLIVLLAPHDVEIAQAIACMVAADHLLNSPGLGVEQGLQHLDLLPDPTVTRTALLVEVARLATEAGRFEEASGLLEQAEALSKIVGSPRWIDGRLEQQRGVVAILRGDLDGASEIASQALARPTTSLARSRLLNLAGIVAVERSAFDDARQTTEASLAIAMESGNLAAVVVDLGNLAEIALRAGHYQAAAQHQLASLTLAQQLGAVREASSALVVAARLAPANGEWATAVQLQAAADAVMSRIGAHLYPTDRALSDALLASAAERLGPDRYDVEHEAGSALAIDEAITEARRVLEARSDEPLSSPR